MTTTISSDCKTLTVTGSTNLDTWFDNQASYTLKLKYRVDCADTYSEYTVATTDVSGASAPYTFSITSTDLLSSSTFSDGVYTIKMELTETATGTITEDADCVLVDCSLGCSVTDYQINNPTSLIRLWYNALLTAINCDDCDCSKPCAIKEKIDDMLNEETSDDCQCG